MKMGCVEFAIAESMMKGETLSGDRHVVRVRPDGVLIAAIDGLGHGHEAARAAECAVAALMSAPEDETTLQLIERSHQALHGTRGAVMSLGILRPGRRTFTWIGIGNVEGLVLQAGPGAIREPLVTRNGLLGDRLPPLVAAVMPAVAGDLIIFATDGIRPDFQASVSHADPLQASADRILANHAKGTDDALVLVARYLGPVN